LSNQEKAELFSDSFGIRSFQGCHGEISPRDQFMPKGLICPEFPISANQPYSDSRNSEIADHLESDNEPSESSESYLTGWYLAIRGFQFGLGLKFDFSLQLLFCPQQISALLSILKIL
jgi:hypothetical protein